MYRQIVESGNEGIWVFDLDGTTVYVNERMAGMLDYTLEEMTSLSLLDVLDDVGRDQGLDFLARQREAGGTTESAECQLLRRDGEPIWTVVSHSPWHDQDGAVLGLIAFVNDITEQHRLQERLQRATDTAIAALQAKSDFLATMSHEIRTPMNGVIGLTELMLATELNDVQRQYVAGLHTAGDALLSIINDILDFSKNEAGRVKLECIDLDVEGVIEEVAGLLVRQAQTKGLELTTRGQVDLTGTVLGDPARLRQILLNLAANAIKFTEHGEVILSASLLASSDETADFRFEVSDTGIGIATADQEHIFEPFSQVDATTTRRFGGTGLGLAISRQLVENMGGELTVESEPGRGSVFSFTIRLLRA